MYEKTISNEYSKMWTRGSYVWYTFHCPPHAGSSAPVTSNQTKRDANNSNHSNSISSDYNLHALKFSQSQSRPNAWGLLAAWAS